MIIYTLILYGVPALLICAAAYIGYLGFKSYFEEIVRR